MNARQQRFVEEYLVDLNASAAAIRAGYSARNSQSIACRMLTSPAIAQAVAEAQARRARRTAVTSDRVLIEAARLGFADVRKLFGEDGRLKPIADLDDDTAAAVASVEVVTRTVPGTDGAEVEYVHKIRLCDKGAALLSLMRHLGMLNDRVDLTVNVNLPARLAAATDRARAQLPRLVPPAAIPAPAPLPVTAEPEPEPELPSATVVPLPMRSERPEPGAAVWGRAMAHALPGSSLRDYEASE